MKVAATWDMSPNAQMEILTPFPGVTGQASLGRLKRDDNVLSR